MNSDREMTATEAVAMTLKGFRQRREELAKLAEARRMELDRIDREFRMLDDVCESLSRHIEVPAEAREDVAYR